MNKVRWTTLQIVRIALLGAILCISQWITPVPNMELISLLVIVYTLVFGRDTLFAILIFDFYMGFTGGFGLWWITYLYAWPVLYVTVLMLKRIIKEDFIMWAIVSGFYGLLFGSLFAIMYIPVSPLYAFNYWIAGLTWDAFHSFTNFVLMLTIGKPIYLVLKDLNKRVGIT